METPALLVEVLTKRFGQRTALRDVPFSIGQGEMVALLGSSGSFKSTLLRHLNGLASLDPAGDRLVVRRRGLRRAASARHPTSTPDRNGGVMNVVQYIQALFAVEGRRIYEGARQEQVTGLEHALQCAQQAEWANAGESVVAAAFLHDIGHLLVAAAPDVVDDAHEQLGAEFLEGHFGPEVTEPIRQHVQAKRYLAATERRYADSLSPASRRSLDRQGGPLDAEGIRRFEALAHAEQALSLRRWDDLAKEPGKRTPPLAYYVELLCTLQQRRLEAPRLAIGSNSVA
jgi:phosphonate degradation associated HDIG domain protein